MNTRVCTSCKVSKDIKEFYTYPTGKKFSKCKRCHRKLSVNKLPNGNKRIDRIKSDCDAIWERCK